LSEEYDAAEAFSGAQHAGTEEGPALSRYVVAAVDLPAVDRRPIHFAPGQVFLITDDGRGIAHDLAAQIRDAGGRAVLARPGSSTGSVAPQIYQADLADPAAAAQLVALVEQHEGPICGIVHLLPLRGQQDVPDLAGWRDRLRGEVKSLFYLASAAAGNLTQASASQGAWVVAATGRGGLNTARNESFFPGHAGIAGLLKTLALEWPNVRCKAVDLDLANAPATLSAQLLQEIAADDRLVEVRYQGARRTTLRPALAPLDEAQPAHLAVDSDSVVLVTGGARGITAEIACALAARYRPTLIVVGSSPWPEADEPPATAGLSSARELKAALIERMRQLNQPFTLPQIEAAYGKLLREREMRSCVERMRRAGALVRYEQVDVRDERSMTRLIGRIYQDHGRLDGVIHGAGIIEDKLLVDKPPESFDRVFDTKVDGAFVLSRALRPDTLKFLVLFSSTAGVFGNRGQSDYAAANEVLNKLAIDLDARWPGRVVAINWGPWAKTGMVSAELQRQFAMRGVHLISIAAGCQALEREIMYGPKGQPEVIVGGWEQPATDEGGNGATAIVLPLLRRATIARSDGAVEAVLKLDPASDRYLVDHQLDGKPVLPAAFAIELMVELAQHGWPGLKVIGLHDLRVLRGLVLEEGSKTLRLLARAEPEANGRRPGVRAHVEIADVGRPELPYYRATVELADALPEPPIYEPPIAGELQPFPLSVGEAYNQWLFHGPIFRGLQEIRGASASAIVATCRPSTPEQCLPNVAGGQWLIDPVMFDCGLQLSVLWSRAYLDTTALISSFQSYRRFRPQQEAPVECHLYVLAAPQYNIVTMNLAFVGRDGRLIGLAENIAFSFSKALNRLADNYVPG
jgi:NAD(P)-dependent dehydrogenase (short-subunit alcohol dehydrogenase family)